MLGTIEGTTGADQIDTAYTGDPEGEATTAAADIIVALQGNDTVLGGGGNDSVSGGDDDDRLFGGDGDDTLRGDAGQDIAFGDAGDDSLDGGAGDDTLKGGTGDDVIAGGAGADNIGGGDDRDTIIGGTNGDEVDGGAGGDDFDVLDLRGLPPYVITDLTPDSNGNGFNGIVRFVDADGNPTGESFTFAEIEEIVEDEDDNRDPVAEPDNATTEPGTLVIIDVLSNDSDPDGDPLTVTSASAPNGTVTINPDGTLSYTPNPGFETTDTITYTISDGNGGTATGQAIVSVVRPNDDPDAVDDGATTPVNTPVSIDVLANDTDINSGDVLTVTSFTQPTNGTVTQDPVTGNLIYTPNPGYVGPDQFGYEISDGNGGTDSALVEITVTPVNSAPDAVDDAASTAPGTPVTIAVLSNDTDPESDPLTVTGVTQGTNGTVALDGMGNPVYTPNAGFTGTDTFTYTISDGNGGTDTATVTVTVEPTPVRDGTVEGTTGGDLIDTSYTGDPDGDFVDNDDAILPGDTGNDDLILAATTPSLPGTAMTRWSAAGGTTRSMAAMATTCCAMPMATIPWTAARAMTRSSQAEPRAMTPSLAAPAMT
jgi:large repetitive protein